MSNIKVIRLSKSCIGEKEKEAVLKVLNHEFLGMGGEVQEFEKQLINFFGRQVACVSTGTAALQLALQAAGIRAGDEVLVQSLTYIASFQAISALGAVPIPCEVEPETLTIDLKDVERRITSKTKAIMPVHYMGGVGDLDEIYDFASRNNLRVIEDAAHSFGTIYKGRKIGSFGDITCFSFDGIKNITSGEGGCVVTNDRIVINNIRDSRLLGVQKDTEQRYKGERSWDFDVQFQGWRYHMSNIMAAIGIEQLKKLPMYEAKRKKLALTYQKQLSGIKQIKLLKINYKEVLPHIFVIRVKNSARDSLRDYLKECGIQTGIHYVPNHFHSYYSKKRKRLFITEEIYKEILTLPLHPDLTDEEQVFVIKKIRIFFD